MKRGEIWLVTFDPTIGHEIQKTRPEIILQNNIGNEHGTLTIVAPITSKHLDRIYPFEVLLPKNVSVLPKDSKILVQQLRSIDKRRAKKRIGVVTAKTIEEIDIALKITRGID